MARRRSNGSFLPFFLFLFLLGVVGSYLFLFTDFFTSSEVETQEEPEQKEEKLLTYLDSWFHEVVWGDQKSTTQTMYYGTAPGVSRTGQFVSRDGAIERFEDQTMIKSFGFSEDLNLTETRKNSELWGYRKSVGDKEQVVVFSSENEDMHVNTDGEYVADCPCTLNISVFVSEVFKPNWKESLDEAEVTPQP